MYCYVPYNVTKWFMLYYRCEYYLICFFQEMVNNKLNKLVFAHTDGDIDWIH